MPQLLTYDAKDVTALVNGQILTGFAAGTFVTITPNADAAGLEVGAAGEGALSLLNDRSASIEVSCFRGSQASVKLDQLARALRSGDDPIFEFSLIENRSGTRVAAAKCWVQTESPLAFSDALDTEAWTLGAFETNTERKELPGA